MTRVAFFLRVSTRGQSLDDQRARLSEHAARRADKWALVAEFEEHGVSGAKRSRPEFDRMLAAARRGEFDVLVCTRLDRLARSVRQLTTAVEELQAVGVELIVLDQAIDTRTPSGRLLFHVLAAIAEFERELIRERTSEARQRSGRKGGRPRALDATARRRLRRLLRAGHSHATVAGMLGVGRATVARELHRGTEA